MEQVIERTHPHAMFTEEVFTVMALGSWGREVGVDSPWPGRAESYIKQFLRHSFPK